MHGGPPTTAAARAPQRRPTRRRSPESIRQQWQVRAADASIAMSAVPTVRAASNTAEDEWASAGFSVCIVWPVLAAALIVAVTAMLVELTIGH